MIGYIETHLVDHCNLNCSGCSHFSNIADPYYKSLEEFEEEMKELSRIGVGIIRLMGGEPMLHPQYTEFCSVARKYFPNSEIVLVTNGLLLNQIDVKAMNENRIKVCMSDYQLNLNRPQYFQLWFTEVHSKGDFYNISLDLSGLKDPTESFNNCDLHRNHWYFFKNGRIYPCCIMANIDIFLNKFELNWEYSLDDISIEIKGHTEEEIQSFLNKPTPLCKYCDTIARAHSHNRHSKTKGGIEEWTCQ